jgi:Tol biopolymer transport system component
MLSAKTTSSLLFASFLAVSLAGCGSDTTGGGGTGSGKEPTEITFDKNADEPRFSPDGKTIAFVQTGADDSSSELGVMDTAGMGRKTLAPAGGYLAGPAWSPDGKQIFFGSNEGISVVPAAGGTATVVVMGFATLDPDVSPDGKSLVYAVNGGGLKIVDLATPTMPKELGSNGTSPRFSPDGKTIAFEDNEKIKIIDIASSQVTEVVDGGTYLASVDWFPDGKRLGITSDKGIEIVTLGTTPERAVVHDEFAAKNVDVSADGKSIAYTVNGVKSIFVISGL